MDKENQKQAIEALRDWSKWLIGMNFVAATGCAIVAKGDAGVAEKILLLIATCAFICTIFCSAILVRYLSFIIERLPLLDKEGHALPVFESSLWGAFSVRSISRLQLVTLFLGGLFVLAWLCFLPTPHHAEPGTAMPAEQPQSAIDRLTSLVLLDELSNVRNELAQPPRTDRQPLTRFPDPRHNERLSKWPEPRKASINQVVMLSEVDSISVVRTLIPLLADSDGVVVAGALYAIREILIQQPTKANKIRQMLPKGWDQSVDLRGACLIDVDLTPFGGTQLFYNAHFEDAVLQNVKFDGITLKGASFNQTTVLECSFRNAILDQSEWQDSRVRATQFDGASMVRIVAEGADFGMATSDPTALFSPNHFSSTILTSAILSRASLAGAQMKDAKLASAEFGGTDLVGAYINNFELASEKLLRADGGKPDAETKYSHQP